MSEAFTIFGANGNIGGHLPAHLGALGQVHKLLMFPKLVP